MVSLWWFGCVSGLALIVSLFVCMFVCCFGSLLFLCTEPCSIHILAVLVLMLVLELVLLCDHSPGKRPGEWSLAGHSFAAACFLR